MNVRKDSEFLRMEVVNLNQENVQKKTNILFALNVTMVLNMIGRARRELLSQFVLSVKTVTNLIQEPENVKKKLKIVVMTIKRPIRCVKNVILPVKSPNVRNVSSLNL